MAKNANNLEKVSCKKSNLPTNRYHILLCVQLLSLYFGDLSNIGMLGSPLSLLYLIIFLILHSLNVMNEKYYIYKYTRLN